jgi:hypothetical protein
MNARRRSGCASGVPRARRATATALACRTRRRSNRRCVGSDPACPHVLSSVLTPGLDTSCMPDIAFGGIVNGERARS